MLRLEAQASHLHHALSLFSRCPVATLLTHPARHDCYHLHHRSDHSDARTVNSNSQERKPIKKLLVANRGLQQLSFLVSKTCTVFYVSAYSHAVLHVHVFIFLYFFVIVGAGRMSCLFSDPNT